LLLAAAAVAGLIGFYFYVHEPLLIRRAEAASQAGRLAGDLRRERNRLSREGDLGSRAEAVAARERIIDAWVPGKNAAALLIWYLSQAEQRSGAHITSIAVGERKQVTATGEPEAKPGPAKGAPKPPQAKGQEPAAPPDEGGDGPRAVTLTMVPLELKVKGRFAQQLLFNQGLEEMPLFLSTADLNLTRSKDEETAAQTGKLLQEGNTYMAAQLLKASPLLDGTYQIRLYFKQEKAGPTTDAMEFATPAGRMDPFVPDGVDEFLRVLMEHYSRPDSGPGPGGSVPHPDPAGGEQLG
jgi:hypothetical protein